MPLIDIRTKRGYIFPEYGLNESPSADTKHVIRKVIGPELPSLFVRNSDKFGMDVDTPEAGVQVQFDVYDEDAINPADIWIKVQFSEDKPPRAERLFIRNRVYEVLVEAFYALGLDTPKNFMFDVFWGPTNGCGTMNGTFIKW